MTKRFSGRNAIWLASAAAVMPVAAMAIHATPAQANYAHRFTPPSEPMILTRTLRRELPGGAEIKAQRSYEIRFVAERDGYRIDGRLIDVQIETPPVLRTLAAIERNRPDTGMFPIHTDRQGILKFGNKPLPGASHRQASTVSRQQVGSLPLQVNDAGVAKTFVSQFENKTGYTAWPADLFIPSPGARSEVKEMPMPDGALGKVSILIDARANGASGLLESFARTVTTDLGGNTRTTEEIWTLASAS